MLHRLIEIILPERRSDDIFELVHGIFLTASWKDRHRENRTSIHPATWWEKNKAQQASRRATGIWFFLLVLLAGSLFFRSNIFLR